MDARLRMPLALALLGVCFRNQADAFEPGWLFSPRGSDRDSTAKIFSPNHATGANTVRRPGPDTADFPDSAFVVPPGGVYLETSLNYLESRGEAAHEYFTATLLRIGVGHRSELRITIPDLIIRPNPADSVVGFGPVTLGAKIHFWDEISRMGLPAAGAIAQVTLQTGSAAFQPETAEPALFLNFDHSLPFDMELEWNIGITWTKENPNHRFTPQAVFLWAISKEISQDISLFVHSLMVGPVTSGRQTEVIVGPGLLWFLGDRIAFDFSYNFGLSSETPQYFVRLGLSLAF